MKPENIDIVHKIYGNNNDIQTAIENAFARAVENTNQNNYFKKFNDNDIHSISNNVWDFLKDEITYKADGFHQKIKLPARLVYEMEGDCKSFALFASSIMYNYAPDNVFLRYTSYNNDKTPTHVYCVLKFGHDEIIIDGVWDKFNSEKNYTFKKDVKMKISTLTGFGDEVITINGNEELKRIHEIRMQIKRSVAIRRSLPKGDERIPALTNKIRELNNELLGISGRAERRKRREERRENRKNKVSVVKKIALAPARIAYLGLVELNVRGLATRLSKALQVDKQKVVKQWERLGGKFDKFEKAILNGAKKKPLLGQNKVNGFDDEIGALPAVAAALAAAAPVIIQVGKLLKSLKVSDEQDISLETDSKESGGDMTDISNHEITDKETGGFKLSTPIILGGVGVLALALFMKKK